MQVSQSTSIAGNPQRHWRAIQEGTENQGQRSTFLGTKHSDCGGTTKSVDIALSYRIVLPQYFQGWAHEQLLGADFHNHREHNRGQCDLFARERRGHQHSNQHGHMRKVKDGGQHHPRLNGSAKHAALVFLSSVGLCLAMMLRGPTSIASLQSQLSLAGPLGGSPQPMRDVNAPEGAAMVHEGGAAGMMSDGALQILADPRNVTAACLLTKDDLSILSEWIAYHYHTANMRYLIVAVDPTSVHSPTPILRRIRDALPDIVIMEWADHHFMPEFFVNRNHNATSKQQYEQQMPDLVPDMFKHAGSSRWHSGNATEEQVRRDAEMANIHRFRQRTFISKCNWYFRDQIDSIQQRQKQQQKQQQLQHVSAETAATTTSATTAADIPKPSLWVLHVDSDEYVVVNPLIRLGPARVSKIPVPDTAVAGSVFRFLENMFDAYPKRLDRRCVSMPTILFGCVEGRPSETERIDDATKHTVAPTIPQPFQPSSFETVRWRWHAPWMDNNNGFFKAIMDVSKLPLEDVSMKGPYVLSPHQPSPQLCQKVILKPEISAGRKFPLTVNHYLGSLERYSSRQDGRHSTRVHQRRANMTGGYEDGWTPSWLHSFVSSVGSETARQVLGDHIVDSSRR